MSAILLSNPFVTPPPAPQTTSVEQPSTALAVAPTQAAFGAGTASGYGNQENTFGNDAGQKALMALSRQSGGMGRPADASPGSVVNAQASDAEVILPFGSNMPEVEMPDILPTAPWFKDD